METLQLDWQVDYGSPVPVHSWAVLHAIVPVANVLLISKCLFKIMHLLH